MTKQGTDAQPLVEREGATVQSAQHRERTVPERTLVDIRWMAEQARRTSFTIPELTQHHLYD